MEMLLPLLLLLLLLSPATSNAVLNAYSEQKCQPVRLQACIKHRFNLTVDEESGPSNHIDPITSYRSLIQSECSTKLEFFLCAFYSPMCVAGSKPISACRELCQGVRWRCEPVMEQFGYSWREEMDCDKFVSSSDGLCLDLNIADIGQGPPLRQITTPPARSGEDRPDATSEPSWKIALQRFRDVKQAGRAPPSCNHLRNSAQYHFVNHSASCVLGCHAQDLFSDNERQLAELWSAVLASMCAASSLLTILTFLMDMRRFRYPLRPVVFMSVCYLCYSCSYFVRLGFGREAAACDTDSLPRQPLLTNRGLDNTVCAVVFLLQYFFSTAASAWYVILVLTWLLQAGWKWSPEAVAKRSCYFHLLAWIVPVGLTVCVLILRKVEADELFGLCNVGSQDTSTLLNFVILPNVAFLILEVVFLIAGFVAMSQVRRHAKLDGQKTNKFDVLMGKIGLFSALYIIPTACVTGLNIHELSSRDLWHVPASPHHPSVAAFLVKTFASLAIGLTAAMWICSWKTVQTWRNTLLPCSRKQSAAAAQRRHSNNEMGLQFPKAAYQPASAHSDDEKVMAASTSTPSSRGKSSLQRQQHYPILGQQLQLQQQQQMQQQQQLPLPGRSTFL